MKLEDDSSPDETKDIAIEDEESENSDQPQVSKSQTSRFAHLENIDFQFEAYDQDICILGSKGSGKSYLANILMKGLHGVNVWVYDFNSQFHSSKAIVFHDLNKMLELYDQAKRGHYILQPHNNSIETFNRFNAEAFKRGNLVLIEDEIHSIITDILKPFTGLIAIKTDSTSSDTVLWNRMAIRPLETMVGGEIIKTTIIKYREAYGGEVGNRVWLQQFFNRNNKSIVNSLKQNETSIIAEHKRKSPSKSEINFQTPSEKIIKG